MSNVPWFRHFFTSNRNRFQFFARARSLFICVAKRNLDNTLLNKTLETRCLGKTAFRTFYICAFSLFLATLSHPTLLDDHYFLTTIGVRSLPRSTLRFLLMGVLPPTLSTFSAHVHPSNVPINLATSAIWTTNFCHTFTVLLCSVFSFLKAIAD